MKIVLLGSGNIMQGIVKSILAAGHQIIGIGTNNNASVAEWEVNGVSDILTDYTDVAKMAADAVLMFSYAPLIRYPYWHNMKFINIHYAMLPRFRGFHGFIWGMINDEPVLGYTVHQVDGGIDSGPIYFQHGVKIEDKDDINSVRVSLDKHLIENIGSYLTEIEKGKIPAPQDEENAIYVTRRRPEDGMINWNWPARLIFNHIRALTPPATPGAFSYHKGRRIYFTKAVWSNRRDYFATPGKVVCRDEGGAVLIKCGDSAIKVTEVCFEDEKPVKPSSIFLYVGMKLDENFPS